MSNNSNLIRQISIASLFLSLGILFLSLEYVVPFISLFYIIFIPFLSAYFTLNSNWKGQLIYLVCSALVSLIYMQTGLFEYLPNVIIGIGYGIAIKNYRSKIVSLVVLISVSFVINYLIMFPINWIYNVDMTVVFSTFFHINIDIMRLIFPTFIFVISSLQSLITFIITNEEMKKLPLNKNIEEKNEFIILTIFILLGTILLVIGAFFIIQMAYVSISFLFVISLILLILQLRFDSPKPIIIEFSVFSLGLIGTIVGLIMFQNDYKYLSLIFIVIINILDSLIMLRYNRSNEIKHQEVLDLENLKND